MNQELSMTKNELYVLIKDVISKKDFERKIHQLQDEFGGLIDEDAAAFYIVDKLGCNKANVVFLSDVHSGQEATVKGMITRIIPPREFTRKNGQQGKVVNLILSDSSGSLPIVLWNEDVSLVESGKIQQNSVVKIINGYSKQGLQGTEVHVGRWSSISIESVMEETAELPSIKIKDGRCNDETTSLNGTILSISPTSVFFKKDDSYGFVSNIHLKTTSGIKKVTFWDDQVKTLQQFNQGDMVNLSYLDIRMNNKEKEYHANGKAVVNRS